MMSGIRQPFMWLLVAFCGIVISQGFTIGGAARLRLGSSSTALQMGLGSFVKKRLGRDGGGDDDKNKKRKVTAPIPRKPIPETARPQAAQPARAPPPVQQKAPAPRKQQASPQRPLPVGGGQETTQDRINRVKQGKMTEDEKQRFLASTLKGSMEPKTLNPGEAPLRQPLAQEAKVVPRNVASATPFPRDSMLREVVTGRKDDKSYDEWKDNNKKKKEYFEMVTDPNRFSSFNTPVPSQAGHPMPADPSGTVMPPSIAPPTADMSNIQIPWEPLDSEPVLEPPEPSSSSTDADHLGARLEAAAMAEEQRQREARRHVELQREEERLKQIELQRAREEEMIIREEENLRKKREAVEQARILAEEKAAQERTRQTQMMQAQEDYWAQKLAVERERKLQKLGAEDELVEEDRMADEARQDAAVAAQIEFDASNQLAMEQQLEADPQAEMYEPVVAPPAPAPVPTPLPFSRAKLRTPLSTGNPFLDEQAQKLADIERNRDDQIAKLKALNSPLPSGPPQGVSPSMPQPGTASTMGRSDSTRNPAAPMRGLSELQRLVNPDRSEEEEYTPPAPASMSIRDAIGQGGGYTPPPAPAPAPAERPGLLGRVFGGNNQEPAPVEDDYYDAPAPAPAPPVPPPPYSSNEPRKVVRQALPMDDEDDEFEAFARGGPNQGMSIGDALKSVGGDSDGDSNDQDERSKMWGIDMSRFN